MTILGYRMFLSSGNGAVRLVGPDVFIGAHDGRLSFHSLEHGRHVTVVENHRRRGWLEVDLGGDGKSS